MHKNLDTITAAATPPGRGGVAIIRISGVHVIEIMKAVLGKAIEPRKATVLPFLDYDATIIDHGIALFFPQPNSFTGEDILELHGHGGTVIVDLLLKRIIEAGARLAQPGEFSLRAFLNGKIDLAQAEAIADLIDAQSTQAARSAMRSLQGEFSQQIHALNERIIQLRLYIEAAIDFSDEDIDFLSDHKITDTLRAIIADLTQILSQAKQGSLLREGVHAAIVGKPNVGKSSLLNRLSGKDIAIVTDIPGTTRDILRNDINIDGMPLHIIDTAGLRESIDIVEVEGIKRAYQAMESADLILYVSDDDYDANQIVNRDERYIFIRNKIDINHQPPTISNAVIALSAKTGAGIQLLIEAIKTKVGLESVTHEGTPLARRRHLEALQQAKKHLEICLAQLANAASELSAEELRLAQRALVEITGEFSADDLLGRIFASFCIGK